MAEPVKVDCVYCEEAVEETEDDPIGIGIVERWRPNDEEVDWMLCAHQRRFVSYLGPDVRDLSDWRPGP